MFTIREVDLNNATKFAYSSNMLSIAEANGWWVPGEPFDFTAIYSGGEYNHKYYSGRRMWRALSLLGGENYNLDPDYEDSAILYQPVYPFAVTPDRPLYIEDLQAIYRDYYAGTPYDLSAVPVNVSDIYCLKLLLLLSLSFNNILDLIVVSICCEYPYSNDVVQFVTMLWVIDMMIFTAQFTYRYIGSLGQPCSIRWCNCSGGGMGAINRYLH